MFRCRIFLSLSSLGKDAVFPYIGLFSMFYRRMTWLRFCRTRTTIFNQLEDVRRRARQADGGGDAHDQLLKTVRSGLDLTGFGGGLLQYHHAPEYAARDSTLLGYFDLFYYWNGFDFSLVEKLNALSP